MPQVLCQPQEGEVFEVLAVDGQGTDGDNGYFFHRVKSIAETGTTDCAGKGSGHIYDRDIKIRLSETRPNYRQ